MSTTSQKAENWTNKVMDIAGRALIGAITFFVYEIYSDFKEMKGMLVTLKTDREVDKKEQEMIRRDVDAHKQANELEFQKIWNFLEKTNQNSIADRQKSK